MYCYCANMTTTFVLLAKLEVMLLPTCTSSKYVTTCGDYSSSYWDCDDCDWSARAACVFYYMFQMLLQWRKQRAKLRLHGNHCLTIVSHSAVRQGKHFQHLSVLRGWIKERNHNRADSSWLFSQLIYSYFDNRKSKIATYSFVPASLMWSYTEYFWLLDC